MFQAKVVEKMKTHILCSIIFFFKSCHLQYMWKMLYNQTGHRWQYGTCAFHAGYQRLQTHTQTA